MVQGASNPSQDAALRVQGLCFSWSGQPLFQQLELVIRPGVSLVTGEDGCGKSTLLSLLAGARQAQAGRFELRGQLLDPCGDAYRKQVYWTAPGTDAHDGVTALDFMRQARNQHPDFCEEALDELIEGFSLEPHLEKPLFMLSAGSKRKVWLSTAFAARTTLTLIDQPFAALDAPSVRFLTGLLQDAADHTERAWVVADHEAPAGVRLATTVAL